MAWCCSGTCVPGVPNLLAPSLVWPIFMRRIAQKPHPADRAGLLGTSGHSPFFLRLRDQIRAKPSPSSSSNRLAKIGALKLGSSSLSER